MESCFEMLHRAVSQGVAIPDSIDSVIGLIKQLRQLYYAIRDHLEADDGISQRVANALPSIELTRLLETLSSWEDNTVIGNREFEQRDIRTTGAPLYGDPADRFHSSYECWNQYRRWMFEANRALDISRQRVAKDAPESQPRRYDWLH